MLLHRGKQICDFTGFGSENLTFAVYNILLQIIGYGFAGAEKFLRRRYGYAHLLAETEKVVNSRLGREDNSTEIGDVDFLCTKILC